MGALLKARWAVTDFVYDHLPRARMLQQQLDEAHRTIARLNGGATRAALSTEPVDRRVALFDAISVGVNRGLEMGPLDKPLMTKDQHKVLYVDHASKADLIKKYLTTGTPETVTPDKICDPDIVWDGKRPLADVTDARNLDFCVSSHVIEHVPNVLGWLAQIGTLLRHGSIINMAVPHRDFTFDRMREVTRPSELIQASLDRRTRPNGGQVFDFIANVSFVGQDDAKVRPDLISMAYKHAWAATQDDFYMDAHCSVFTPQSFLECFEVISYTGLINFKLRKIWPATTQGNEFIVSLEFGGFTLGEMAQSFRDGAVG